MNASGTQRNEINPADLAQYGKAIVFDPQDLRTLFQDSAGTTPVTDVEQPVGKMLDKGGGNFHATQSTAGSRPKLSARYNMLVGTSALATQSVTTLATDYTLSFSGTGTVTLSGTTTGTKSAGVHVFTTTAGSLTLTANGQVTNAQLVATNQASLSYQSVTSATVYDSDPSKFPYYLKFTDHWMATPSIDASAYDKVMVACGLRKMSDAASGLIAESSASAADGTNPGAFVLYARVGGAGIYSFVVRGVLGTSVPSTEPYLAPITNTLIGMADISNDICDSRVNGALAQDGNGDRGTGSCGNYPIYIGKRAGVSYAFNGYLYGLTVLFPTALPNDNLIQALERHYAAKSGIRL